MLNDCTHEVMPDRKYIKSLCNIEKYIYCKEIADVFARNLIFMGFINFLWFDGIREKNKMISSPGMYLFLDRMTKEIKYVGCSDNVRERIKISYKNYQPHYDYIIVIPTRTLCLAKRLETIFVPLFDPERNKIKVIHGKRR